MGSSLKAVCPHCGSNGVFIQQDIVPAHSRFTPIVTKNGVEPEFHDGSEMFWNDQKIDPEKENPFICTDCGEAFNAFQIIERRPEP